jgi:esterase/lipase superfamily enzyme
MIQALMRIAGHSPPRRQASTDFDERRMNVRMKKFASDRRIVVFVHGFNGCGYSTWEKFPEILASRGVVPWTMTFGL